MQSMCEHPIATSPCPSHNWAYPLAERLMSSPSIILYSYRSQSRRRTYVSQQASSEHFVTRTSVRGLTTRRKNLSSREATPCKRWGCKRWGEVEYARPCNGFGGKSSFDYEIHVGIQVFVKTSYQVAGDWVSRWIYFLRMYEDLGLEGKKINDQPSKQRIATASLCCYWAVSLRARKVQR
jgi:hypothetical protein